MARIQYYAAATLDGYIAESDDSIGWLMGYSGSFEGENVEPPPMSDEGAYERFYDGIGAIVSGSTTYEFVLEHTGEDDDWPYAGKPVWVLTSRELAKPPQDDADVRIVKGEVAALREEMMASANGKNLWVLGGGNVASQFADEGLLDDVLVTVVPVVLGAGKPLFDRRLPGGPMELTETRVFENGMVELSYAIGGRA